MSFNLVEDPWIPVQTNNAKSLLVSLRDLFENGADIRDLAVNPIQRIALMRLLICIVQAALDGPENEEDWINCRQKISNSASNYLGKWKTSFELYGNPSFMQISDLTCNKDGDKPLDVLDCRSPHGGSCTSLFDHGTLNTERKIPDAVTAMNLLTVLNFSTGGKVGQAIWSGILCNHSTFAAPCIKAAHTFIRAADFLSTLHLNLLTKHGNTNGIDKIPNVTWGRPVWEEFPKNPKDNDSLRNATETYLGRLVPLSRLVNLSMIPGRCIFGPTTKGFQIRQLPEFREPSTTVVTNDKGEQYYLSISSTKHVWRDLGAILSRQTNSKKSSAISLKAMETHAATLGYSTVDLWVGGLELGAQAAKLNELVEWNLSIPLSGFQDTSLRRYERGVQLAENGAKILRQAIITYFKTMHEQMDTKNIPYKLAESNFWSELDIFYNSLIEVSADHSISINDVWHPIVYGAMNTAFEQSCPHTTPRQIQAFAKARKSLKLKKLSDA